MTTTGQQAFIDHLRIHFIGLKEGDDETAAANPVYAYPTGMLFPVEIASGPNFEKKPPWMSEAAPRLSRPSSWRKRPDDSDTSTTIGNLTAASSWTPSSMGLLPCTMPRSWC